MKPVSHFQVTSYMFCWPSGGELVGKDGGVGGPRSAIAHRQIQRMALFAKSDHEDLRGIQGDNQGEKSP